MKDKNKAMEIALNVGLALFELFQTTIIILKLCKVITCPWNTVLLPTSTLVWVLWTGALVYSALEKQKQKRRTIMENKINAITSIFKRMLQDAEREDRSGILIPLAVEQAVIILKALDMYAERMQPCTLGDTEGRADNVAREANAANEGNTGETVSRYASPLGETVEGMLSPDYKERFKAEYAQTKIRYERLKAFNTKIEAAFRAKHGMPEPSEKTVEEPAHDCPSDLLRDQQRAMGEYLHVLEVRAVIEGIDLGGC